MKKINILFVFGTRPEVIKMAPVIKEVGKYKDIFSSFVAITGQHKEMCKPYLDLFSIFPDYDMSIMEKNQTLNSIVTNILKKSSDLFDIVKPDIVLVQGDTTSAFTVALACYHNKLKVGHIEAGLRTRHKYNPFPEEMNRQLIGVLADLHFAPTFKAKNNLVSEGVNEDNIFVTGNTVIDAMLSIANDKYEFMHDILKEIDFANKRVICVTTHRRESFGKPLMNSLQAIKKIITLFSDVEIVLPVHYNPNVKKKVHEVLGQTKRIHLIEPLPYEPFIQLLAKSYIILTDSGGIQEEAPSLGKPVLVLRETTERYEGVTAGTAVLVGTNVDNIVSNVSKLMQNQMEYKKMAHAVNPYGDGTAAHKIVEILQNKLLIN